MGNIREPSILGDLALQCHEDSARWFPDVAKNVAHHTLGLCGEVGEFANLIKKIDRGSLDTKDGIVRYNVAMELTDVFIYLLNLAALLHIDLYHAYEEKRRQNNERFTRSANGVLPNA